MVEDSTGTKEEVFYIAVAIIAIGLLIVVYALNRGCFTIPNVDISKKTKYVTYTIEEDDVNEKYAATIAEYMTSMRLNFVIGSADINNDAVWNEYVNQFELNLMKTSGFIPVDKRQGDFFIIIDKICCDIIINSFSLIVSCVRLKRTFVCCYG